MEQEQNLINTEIDINSILDMIPHRYPFLLVDRIIDIRPNESIQGLKNITFNEPQFTGHFPGNPVMPGVLIIEAMAQVSAILIARSLNIDKQDKLIYFMSIDNTKFRRIIKPGDSVHIYSHVLNSRVNAWKFTAKAFVEDKIAAESTFTAMVKDISKEKINNL